MYNILVYFIMALINIKTHTKSYSLTSNVLIISLFISSTVTTMPGASIFMYDSTSRLDLLCHPSLDLDTRPLNAGEASYFYESESATCGLLLFGLEIDKNRDERP